MLCNGRQRYLYSRRNIVTNSKTMYTEGGQRGFKKNDLRSRMVRSEYITVGDVEQTVYGRGMVKKCTQKEVGEFAKRTTYGPGWYEARTSWSVMSSERSTAEEQ